MPTPVLVHGEYFRGCRKCQSRHGMVALWSLVSAVEVCRASSSPVAVFGLAPDCSSFRTAGTSPAASGAGLRNALAPAVQHQTEYCETH